MKYCDECIHFVPGESEKRSYSSLCDLKHEMEFKEPCSWIALKTFDYGFHHKSCKDFQKVAVPTDNTWTITINEKILNKNDRKS